MLIIALYDTPSNGIKKKRKSIVQSERKNNPEKKHIPYIIHIHT